MEGRGVYVRLGLLIVGGIAALVGLVIFLSGERLSTGTEFESYFRESVQGLDVGAPVKFRGVTLGRVTGIGLVSAEYPSHEETRIKMADYQMVVVRYLINMKKLGVVPDVPEAIALGLRARLSQQGITGLAFIELDFVSNPAAYPVEKLPWTPSSVYIPSTPSTLLQVQDAAQRLLAKLNEVDAAGLVSAATGMVNDLRTQLKDGDLHRTLADADVLIRQAQTDLHEADLPAVAADMRKTLANIQGVADGPELKAVLARTAVAVDRFAQAADRLAPLLTTLQATARRADNSTADIEQQLGPLLRDAATALANLRETTDTLRRYPSSVLLGGPPPRVQETR
jgi:paraquat-inducible protein B